MKRSVPTLVSLLVLAALLLTGDSTSRSLPAESLMSDPLAEAIDAALFQRVPLLDLEVDFPRPTAEAESELLRLASEHGDEPEILSALADVQLRLGRFDEAQGTMRRLAEIHDDPAQGLQQLASFYHGRLRIDEEVATLQRLAEIQEGAEKVATCARILQLLDLHLLEGLDRIAILREMISAEPDEPAHVRALIEQFIDEGRSREAADEADAALRRFPDSRRAFIELKADILRRAGDAEGALAVYDVAFDPVEDLELFNDYLSLLRRLERYGDFERSLRRHARLGRLDDRGHRSYFLLLRSQRRYDDAEAALDTWLDSIAEPSREQLRLFADAYAALGKTSAAWRLAYALYIVSGDPEAREEALARLFHLTWELRGEELNPGGRGIGSYIRRRHFDTGPGLVGGLLSLLYNDQRVPEKLEDLEGVSRDHENRALLMRLFERFRADFPRSDSLAAIYARVVEMFNDYNRPRLALRHASEFMESFPDDELYGRVAEAAVASYRQLGRQGSVRSLYGELLRRADRRGERDDYLRYLSALVQSHVGENDYAGAIELYWTEINAHPDDETLYQRLLEFLGRYRIYDEELRVYNQAIERFADRGYHHRLARWYIRQRRTADFQDLTRRIADIFEESELNEFFRDFLNSGRNVGDPDSVFFRTMFEYANRRFPRDIRFVTGLLDFYRRFDLWPEFDALSKRYFYASESIRRGWLRSLSRRGLLAGVLEHLAGGERLPLNREAEPSGAAPQSLAERLLLAELALWNSHFEAALPLFDGLLELYPGDEQLLSAAASLRRSFSLEGAAGLYDRLSRLRPSSREYPTLAGEVLFEAGRAEEAAERWLRIIEIEPSNADVYLEAASIFWDYFLFDEAAEVLLLARRRLDDPALFGQRLAAVYESAHDYPRAVAELVRAAALRWEHPYERQQPVDRLVHLARRRSMAGEIDSAFSAAITAAAGEHRYVQAYSSYLESMGEDERRLELLRSAIERYDDRGFLNWLAGLFRRQGRHDSEERTLRRLISVEGENAANLLALAEFFERRGGLDDAQAILGRRVDLTRTEEPEELSDYLAALDDAARFAWRHDHFEAAFDRWGAAADASSGAARAGRKHALAQRYIQRERFAEASAILEELLAARPSSPQLFNTLARIYSLRDDYAGLAALYRRAVEVVRADAELGPEARTSRIAELRLGLIENLIHLGDFTAALDQYVEIVNRDYDDEGILATAYRFAARHGLLERLLGYYTATSERSFRDFRWNVVLARLHQLDNRLADAEGQWRAAIRNEPQRIELHSALAGVYLRLQRYAEAVEVYRQIYRLDRRNDRWLLTIARTQALAGDVDAARETLEGMLAGEPPGYRKYFEVAAVLDEWGELEAAAGKLDIGLERLRADIYRERLAADHLTLYINVHLKLGRTLETFNTLLDLNSIYTREATRRGNPRAFEARQGQRLTYSAFSGSFARALLEFSNDAQRRQIAQRLEGYLDAYGNNADTVRFVREVGESLGFAAVTERAIGARLGLLNSHNSRYDYRRAIHAALRYYGRRGAWSDAARMLERELSRSTMFHFRSEMLSLLADLHRYGGESEGEIRSLRSYWSETGGDELGFRTGDPCVERFLALLLERGDDAALREVARTANAYSGQAIDFFLARGRLDLADAAVGATALRRSPAWRDSKRLLLQAYGGEPGLTGWSGGIAERLMQLEPIAERTGRRPDRQRVLVGGQWFGFAPHLVELLFNEGDERFRALAPAPAEGSPRSAAAQRSIARWYAGHQLYDDALRQYQLALQLGDAADTYVELGELHHRRGDRDEALRWWGRLIEGEASTAAYGRYFLTLADNGYLDLAAEAVLPYLERALPGAPNYEVRDLLGTVIWRLHEEGDLGPAVSMIAGVAGSMDEPLEFVRYVLDYLELPARQRLPIYERAVELAEEESGVGEVAGDGRVLRHWLELAIEFAVDNGLPERALAWIGDYEARGFAELARGARGRARARFWQLKARALLALGDADAALEALRSVYETDPPRLDNYQLAHSILLDAGAVEEAEELMIGFYRGELADGRESAGTYTGLAAIQLGKAERADGLEGDSLLEEAVGLLDRMVNMEANNAAGMRDAAVLLESKGLRGRALRYRRMLALLDPLDGDNALALAADLAATGEGDEALAAYRRLLMADAVPRSLKLRAWRPYLELVGERPQLAAEDAQYFSGRAKAAELDVLIAAELERIAGRSERQRTALADGLSRFFEPSLLAARLAELESDAGDRAAAIEHLRTAMRNEPGAATRLALLRALLDAGRTAEALQLLDRLDSGGLGAQGSGELTELLGLGGRELFSLYEILVDAALDEELFYAAAGYERGRVELGHGLGLEVVDRSGEIEELRRSAEPPEPPVRIVDEIAN